MSSFFSGQSFNNLRDLLGFRPSNGIPRQVTQERRVFSNAPLPGSGQSRFFTERTTQQVPETPNALQRLLSRTGPSGEVFLRASESDRTRLQEAEDTRFSELQRVLGRAEGAFTGGAAEQRRISEEGRVGAQDLAARQREEFEAAQTRLETGFRDTSAQQGQVLALGIRRNRDTQLAAIQNSPDLSPEEKFLQTERINQAANEQVTATLATLGADFNQTLAGLRTQGQAGRLQSQAGESALFQFGEQFRQAGLLAATQLETQGFFQLAQLIESSPVVSALTGITQLIALAESGQMDNIPLFGPTVTGSPNQGFNMGLSGAGWGTVEGERRGSASRTTQRTGGPPTDAQGNELFGPFEE